MMTQLKSYLLQSTELQALLEPQHQYTQDKLGNFDLYLVEPTAGGLLALCHFLWCHYAKISHVSCE